MIIEQGNSYCQITKATEDELKKAAQLLSYYDEEKEKKIRFLQRAYQKALMRRQLRKVHFLAGEIKKVGDVVTCLLDKDNRFPSGLMFKIREHAKIVDKRIKPEAYNLFRWNNTPPPMRYYQEDCVRLASEKSRGTFEVCVGGGKTLIAANIIKNTGVNTLFIVPSSALSQQTFEVFSNYFGKKNVVQLTSAMVKSKKKLAPIIISTVQTLASLVKQGIVEHVTDNIESLMIDEAHHGAADSYMKLLPFLNNVYYRYNFSGTYTRNDNKFMELWGVCDERLYSYNSAQATKDGYLTPVEFIIKPLHGTPGSDYQDEYKLNYGGKVFHDAIVDTVKDIPGDKQILILIDRKDMVGQQIKDWLDIAGIDSTYVTGDNDKKELTDAMARFNDKDIRILIASTVLGEGADIRSTDYLILGRGGKSEIAVTQAIGRAVRLYEGKNTAYVIDFEFQGTMWLKKHTKLRKETYANEFAATF